MLSKNRDLRRNTSILIIAFLFLTLGIGAATENAQTKSTKKPAASSVAKKPTPTPKKTDKKDSKTTAKTSTDKKNADKKAADKKIADKKAADKKAADKKIADKKAADKKNTKTTAKSTTKPAPPKTTAKATVKPAPKSTSQTPKTTPKPSKPVTPKTVAPPESQNLGQAIVIVTSARVRAEPNTNASEVRRLKLGTLVKVVEENPTWYKVEFSGSSKPASGWMSKQVASDFSENNRTTIYRQIVDRNYKEEKMSFADAAELYDFLTRAQNELANSNAAPEMSFKRILALQSALKAVPFGKAEEKPYSDFLKSNNKIAVYSEPSGEWYVRSETLWDLQKKYLKDAVAEEIAWKAAQNPLPGECEGYVNCYLFVLRETDGEYLTRYPNGKYSEQSLKNIQSLLDPISADLKDKSVYNGPSDVSDRAEFNRLISELRSIVSRLPFAEIEKQKAIQQLNRIAEGYR